MTTTRRPYHSEFARRYYNQGEARAVLAILDARGVDVPEEVRVRITTCTDLDQLDTRVRRAITADKIQDLDDEFL